MLTVPPGATVEVFSITRVASSANRGSLTATSPTSIGCSPSLRTSTSACREATSERSCSSATVTPSGSSSDVGSGPAGEAEHEVRSAASTVPATTATHRVP